MKRLLHFKNFLTASLFLALLFYTFISTNHTVAANSDSAKSDLIKNSEKNSKSHTANENSSLGNNNTKQNEMSIQICDKSHPCKTGTSKGNLQ